MIRSHLTAAAADHAVAAQDNRALTAADARDMRWVFASAFILTVVFTTVAELL